MSFFVFYMLEKRTRLETGLVLFMYGVREESVTVIYNFFKDLICANLVS